MSYGELKEAWNRGGVIVVLRTRGRGGEGAWRRDGSMWEWWKGVERRRRYGRVDESWEV